MDVTLPRLLAAHFPAVHCGPASLLADIEMADYTDSSRMYRRLSPEERVRPLPLVELLTFTNPVFAVYVFWSSVLLLKMLAVYAAIVWQRSMKPTLPDKNNNPSTSRSGRLWRALRNDAENILPLLFAGFFYVLTAPDVHLAVLLFRLIGFGRLLHTFLYTVLVFPQPVRFFAFLVPFCTTGFMTIKASMFFAGNGESQQPQWARI